MYQTCHSSSGQSKPNFYFIRNYFTGSSFKQSLLGQPKLCNRRDAGKDITYLAKYITSSFSRLAIRKYGLPSFVKFVSSVSPTRLPRTLYTRFTVHLLANSISSKWKDCIVNLNGVSLVRERLCTLIRSLFQKYLYWNCSFSKDNTRRLEPSRMSYYLWPLNQLFAQFCP